MIKSKSNSEERKENVPIRVPNKIISFARDYESEFSESAKSRNISNKNSNSDSTPNMHTS